jgi:peptide/nickel transport system permease protein
MMRSFAARRLAGLAGTVVVAVLLTFVIVPLIPGDPAVSAAGPDATIEQIEQVRAELGLDRPLAERFVDYVGGLLQGDMGHSFSLNAPVADVVFGRLPFTAGLAFASLVVVLLVAVPVGMTVGVLTRGGRRRWLDSAFGYTTAVVAAIPPYVMATLLVLVFAVSLAVLPPAYSRSRVGISLVLPLMALSIPSICFIARVVRRETAVVLEQDYLRTARGWRLGALRTYARYALPNLLTSTLTLSGIILIGMLGGAITVETVFSWPGLGLGIVNAVTAKDYPLIQGIVLVLAVLSALLTLAVDVVLGLVDPRVRNYHG